MCVFILKIDCLIVEFKFLFVDVYYKFCYMIEEINGLIEMFYILDVDGVLSTVSSENGKVCFGSVLYGFSFILELFVKFYVDVNGVLVDYKEFVKRMWGDVYYYGDMWMFKKKLSSGGGERIFV